MLPRNTTSPNRAPACTACRKVCGSPIASTILSAPAPPVRARIASTGSPSRGFTGWKPMEAASASFVSSMSTTKTSEHPRMRIHWAAMLPIGPAPNTAPVSPGRMASLDTPCSATAQGSVRAASRRLTLSGHTEQVRLGRPDRLGERAVPPGAEVVVVRALREVSGLAGNAAPAGNEGKHRDPCPLREPAGRGCLDDRARELVAHDQGIAVGARAEAAVDVRIADPGEGDLDPRPVGARPHGIGHLRARAGPCRARARELSCGAW